MPRNLSASAETGATASHTRISPSKSVEQRHSTCNNVICLSLSVCLSLYPKLMSLPISCYLSSMFASSLSLSISFLLSLSLSHTVSLSLYIYIYLYISLLPSLYISLYLSISLYILLTLFLSLFLPSFLSPSSLDGPNLQSPIASVQRTRSTLASHSAGPCGTSTAPTNANRAIRIATQRTQGLRGPNSVFLGGDMTTNER